MYDQAPTWIAHNLAYGFLGIAFKEPPSAEFIQTLVENDLFADWPLESDQPDMRAGLAGLREFTDQWAEAGFSALKRDYADLFIGPAHLLAAPWESVYRSPERIIFDAQTLEVRNCYRRWAMEVPTELHEPEDHFGLEMRFIAHLSALALAALQYEDVEQLEQVTQALQSFLTEHVLCWSAEFLEAVQTHAQTAYYQNVARLATGCLAHTAQLLHIEIPVI